MENNEYKELNLSLNKIKDILIKNDLLIDFNIGNKNVNYISCDSRNVKDNSLFLCKGEFFKKEYLLDALKNGAIAYVSEEKYNIDGVSYFVVSNILKAIGLIAIEFYNNPDKKLNKIGVTGTKGKTTVTYIIHSILEEYVKSKVGLISSIDLYTGVRSEKSHITTPESIDIEKYFYEMVQSNIKYATIEVSSQSYKRFRLEGVKFEYGLFLNIDKDHISGSEHPNFEDYLSCKIEFLKNCKNVLINKNTDHFEEIINSVKDKNIVLFGTDDTADYYIQDIKRKENGFLFLVKNDKIGYSNKFEIKMQGRFNLENALAAIAVSKMLNIDDESIQKGLLKIKVPGRMMVYEKNGRTVIIDYAHNALSFKKLYESIKLDYPNRKIISVGGAVGGKAFNRREDFGKIVGKNSDYIYLTTDDPQFEKVRDICNEIGRYINDKTKYKIIINRKKAIISAIKKSEKGDVIVLLSKGTDNYQRIKNKEVPYESDVKIVEDLIKS